ncbi:MAG: universal stress protein [Hyphomicrobiales bacterium]|nr:universal stress protein [Hyphomicrobiales bacterium]
MSFKKLLIAIDESPIATRAVEADGESAQKRGAHVALDYAIDQSALFGAGGDIPRDELETAAEHDGARLMADSRALPPAGVAVQQFIPQRPAEIVKTAREWGANLVVVGSNGRRGISRARVGGVAASVMRHAPCPRVVARGRE